MHPLHIAVNSVVHLISDALGQSVGIRRHLLGDPTSRLSLGSHFGKSCTAPVRFCSLQLNFLAAFKCPAFGWEVLDSSCRHTRRAGQMRMSASHLCTCQGVALSSQKPSPFWLIYPQLHGVSSFPSRQSLHIIHSSIFTIFYHIYHIFACKLQLLYEYPNSNGYSSSYNSIEFKFSNCPNLSIPFQIFFKIIYKCAVIMLWPEAQTLISQHTQTSPIRRASFPRLYQTKNLSSPLTHRNLSVAFIVSLGP